MGDAAQASAHAAQAPAQAENRATATIRCTPDNAAQVRAIVHAWPEAERLIAQLRKAELFPGLRSLTFTVEGTREECARGLATVLERIQQPEGGA